MQQKSIVDYNSVNTSLYWLNSHLVFDMSVLLFRNNKLNKTKFVSTEYQSANGAFNLSIDLNWWMHLKYINTYTGDKYEYSISSSDIYQYTQAIATIKSWITNPPNGKKLYAQDKDGSLRCISELGSVKIVNKMGDTLEMMPAVYQNTMNTEQTPGIAIIINDNANVIVTISDFLNYAYLLEHLSPFNMAMEMLNYVNIRTCNMQEFEINGGTTGIYKNMTTPMKSEFTFLKRLGATEREASP